MYSTFEHIEISSSDEEDSSDDNHEIVDLFRNRYGDRIITRENYKETMGDRGRWQKEGIIDAMIDLLLLSKNKTLIGTYISTFSELSWWYSGCKQNVYIL